MNNKSIAVNNQLNCVLYKPYTVSPNIYKFIHLKKAMKPYGKGKEKDEIKVKWWCVRSKVFKVAFLFFFTKSG